MDEPGNAIPARRTLTAPLGSSRDGRLRFTSGANRVAVRADMHLQGLYRVRFGSRTPTVRVQGGTVTIRYPRFPKYGWLDCWSERPAEVTLNTQISWDIDIRGGASRLLADLRELGLVSLRLEGGAGRVEVALPAPSGTVAVLILGGASNVSILRPEGVAARLRVEGGVTNLRFGEKRVDAAGGEVGLDSGDYEGAGRYDVAVTGGANNLNIGTWRERHEGVDLDLEGA
jgi:hypothetical protein